MARINTMAALLRPIARARPALGVLPPLLEAGDASAAGGAITVIVAGLGDGWIANDTSSAGSVHRGRSKIGAPGGGGKLLRQTWQVGFESESPGPLDQLLLPERRRALRQPSR